MYFCPLPCVHIVSGCQLCYLLGFVITAVTLLITSTIQWLLTNSIFFFLLLFSKCQKRVSKLIIMFVQMTLC